MLKAYEKGLDLHAVTGAKLAQVPLEEFLTWKDTEAADLSALYEKHRGNAKPANFGLIYGMSAEGFQAYAWANYGIKIISEEATKMRDAFFELYPGLLDYHQNQKDLVRAHEMVRSPLGRVRHLPMIRSWDRALKSKAERQAINSPIQSTLSDMMIWAIALLDKAYPGGEIETVGMIHDAMIAYVPEEDAEVWAGRAVQLMSNLPFHEVDWKPQLKFTADAEAGYDLANMKKLKLAA
jgi:DNA polymerase I-like protein with 3'-5' exonuclease and polymerase domains